MRPGLPQKRVEKHECKLLLVETSPFSAKIPGPTARIQRIQMPKQFLLINITVFNMLWVYQRKPRESKGH